MKHKMNLNDIPFNLIKNGTKIIEMRLFDEKRQLINIGDIIEFNNRETNENLSVIVENIFIFNTFEELYNSFDKISLGYSEEEDASYKDMELYYSIEEQNKYGVVGIKIKVLN